MLANVQIGGDNTDKHNCRCVAYVTNGDVEEIKELYWRKWVN